MCAGAAYSSYGFMTRLMSSKVALLCAIAIAVAVYALAILLSKTLTSYDLITIPGCKKIVKALEKYHLVG
jgi:hypothetical protein